MVWKRLIAAVANDAVKRAAEGLQPYPPKSTHSMLMLQEAAEIGGEDDPLNICARIEERLRRNPTDGFGRGPHNLVANRWKAWEAADRQPSSVGGNYAR